MSSRLRLNHFVVQVVLSVDDGENLNPGPAVQPQVLTLAGLRDLASNWPQRFAELEAQQKEHEESAPAKPTARRRSR